MSLVDLSEALAEMLACIYESENISILIKNNLRFQAQLHIVPHTIAVELDQVSDEHAPTASVNLTIDIFANLHVALTVEACTGIDIYYEDDLKARLAEAVDSQPSATDGDVQDIIDWVIECASLAKDHLSSTMGRPPPSMYDDMVHAEHAQRVTEPETPTRAAATLSAELRDIDYWEKLQATTARQPDPEPIPETGSEARPPSGLSVSVPVTRSAQGAANRRVQELLVHLLQAAAAILSRSQHSQRDMMSDVMTYLQDQAILSADVVAEAAHPAALLAHLQQSFGVDAGRSVMVDIDSRPRPEQSVLRLFTTPMDIPGAHILQSRYRADFTELGTLGQGGFGLVVKAKNRIDGQSYAVKKIPMSALEVDSDGQATLVQEVTTLARLHHRFVVRYFTAWLETSDAEAVQLDQALADTFDSGTGNTAQLGQLGDTGDIESHLSHTVLPDGPMTYTETGLMHGTTEWSESDSYDTDDYTDDNASFTSSEGSGIDLMALAGGMEGVSVGARYGDPVEIPEPDEPNTVSPLVVGSLGRGFERPIPAYQPPHVQPMNIPHPPPQGLSNGWQRVDKRRRRIRTPSIPTPTPSSHERPDQLLYIQMELCDGLTLRDALDGGLDALGTAASRFRLFGNLVEAMAHIHSLGIIHRDLKPANIFLNRHLTTPKIGDFGLAVQLQDRRQQVQASKANSLEDMQDLTLGVGTQLYMAPELDGQSLAKGVYSAKVDVFALGIILLEMFYTFETRMERMDVVRTLVEKRTLPEEFTRTHDRIARLVLLMTNPSPTLRPTIVELQEDPLMPPKIGSDSCTEIKKLIESDIDGTHVRRIVAEALMESHQPDSVEPAIEDVTGFTHIAATSLDHIERYVKLAFQSAEAVHIPSAPFTYIQDADARTRPESLKVIDGLGRPLEIPFDLTNAFIPKVKNMLQVKPQLGIGRWLRRYEVSGVLRNVTEDDIAPPHVASDSPTPTARRHRMAAIDLIRTIPIDPDQPEVALPHIGVVEAEVLTTTVRRAIQPFIGAVAVTIGDIGILRDVLMLCSVPAEVHSDVIQRLRTRDASQSSEMGVKSLLDAVATKETFARLKPLLFPATRLTVTSDAFHRWTAAVGDLAADQAAAHPYVAAAVIGKLHTLLTLSTGPHALLASIIDRGVDVTFLPSHIPCMSVFSGLCWSVTAGRGGDLLAVGGHYSYRLNHSPRTFPHMCPAALARCLAKMHTVTHTIFGGRGIEGDWVRTIAANDKSPPPISQQFTVGVGCTILIDALYRTGAVMSPEMIALTPSTFTVYVTGDPDASAPFTAEKLALVHLFRERGFRALFSLTDTRDELMIATKELRVAVTVTIQSSEHRVGPEGAPWVEGGDDGAARKARRSLKGRERVRQSLPKAGPVVASVERLKLVVKLQLMRKHNDKGRVCDVAALMEQVETFRKAESDERLGRTRGKEGRRRKPDE